MTTRKAILSNDGTVENVILLEDGANWSPPENTTIVDDDGTAKIGGKFVKGKFGPPPEPEPRKPEDMTLEEKVEALMADVELLRYSRPA